MIKLKWTYNNHVLIQIDKLREANKFVYLGCELRKDGDMLNGTLSELAEQVLRLRVCLE